LSYFGGGICSLDFYVKFVWLARLCYFFPERTGRAVIKGREVFDQKLSTLPFASFAPFAFNPQTQLAFMLGRTELIIILVVIAIMVGPFFWRRSMNRLKQQMKDYETPPARDAEFEPEENGESR
jgi:hypothetical protein